VDFHQSNLWEANLDGANLRDTDLSSANLNKTSLINADLRGASLRYARLVEANVSGARFSGCHVYGCSIWNLNGDPSEQADLVVTPLTEPRVTADNLEIAQFIYLLLNNKNIRHVIDTITSKVVLILGRFTRERKVVLDAIRDELRKRDYLPVMFDFDKPSTKTTLETVSTLAHMAKFVIADISDPKCVLQELQAIVPLNPCLPVQPLLINSQEEPGMFDFFRAFPWVLEPYVYENQDRLLAALTDKVIGPAEAKANERAAGR
jgi:Pentapeptide repeats (8 copies)